MDDYARNLVEICDVSKKFCKNRRAARRHLRRQLLKSFLPGRIATTDLGEDEFWALENVSLSLKRGEVLGIIGLNGSGKSTLLKLINGLILPDKGTLTITGEVGGLIELGAGFQPDLTGRENIFIKGALIGKSKEEIDKVFDSIVEFGELEDFIDLPVKNYSSGMTARLGFSVSVHQEPDVLLMDEVLAVGDFNFQQKCLAKVNEMRRQKTILLVSHSMNSVKMFCDRVIVLENGHLIFDGDPAKAITHYLESEKRVHSTESSYTVGQDKDYMGEFFHNKKKITKIEHAWNCEKYKHGEEMVFSFSFECSFDPHSLIIGIPIWNDDGFCITSFNSDHAGVEIAVKNGKVCGRMKTRCHLNPGNYDSVIAIMDGTEFLYRQKNSNIWVANKERLYGLVTFQQQWTNDD